MLLSTYDMSNSHEMIVYRSGKVVQRPHPILRADPRMRILLRINNSKSGPISDCRIRVSRLRLHSNYCLSFLQLSTEHPVPLLKILSPTVRPVGTSPA